MVIILCGYNFNYCVVKIKKRGGNVRGFSLLGLGHFYFRAFYLVKCKNNSGYHTAFHTIGCTKSFIYHALTPHNDAVEWSFFS